LDTLSQALNTTKIGIDGEAFLVDHNGNLVGLSNPKRLNFTFKEVTPVTLIMDRVFQDAITFVLSQSKSNFSQVPVISSRTVPLGDRAYLLSTFHIASSSDLNWTAIVIIPRENYFATSDLAVQRALIIGLCIVVALIVATIVATVFLLTIPLRRLERGMNAVAKSLTAPTLRRRSFIQEVDSMERAYGNMASGIHSFSKYVPGPVVRQLLEEDGEPRIGVSNRVCTFFFSDIVGFTSISKNINSSQLNVLLSEYFGRMEGILHDLHGITTDFLGDGIFVFWNAPSYNANHALLACEAALRQQATLKLMGSDWEARGLPRLRIRIGINTGPCLVGNFGSVNHLKYTVMGDAVNVASRLEQLNKLYNTSTLIGSETFEVVKDQFVCRVVDIVLLKGKSELTKVYELLCRMEERTEALMFLQQKADEMLGLFVEKQFTESVTVGEEILLRFPADVPTLLLRERCIEMQGMALSQVWSPARELIQK
jgi:adenylate cyclase